MSAYKGRSCSQYEGLECIAKEIQIAGILALGVLLGQMVAGKTWNTEVSAQMEQVERAESSIDRDEVDVRRAGQHDHRAFDISVFKADEDIGAALVVGVACGLRSDEVFPSAIMVLLADGLEAGRVVKSGPGKFIDMHRDAVQVGHDPSRVLVFDEIVGQRQHGAIEGEVCAKRGMLTDSVHIARNPRVVLGAEPDGEQSCYSENDYGYGATHTSCTNAVLQK